MVSRNRKTEKIKYDIVIYDGDISSIKLVHDTLIDLCCLDTANHTSTA